MNTTIEFFTILFKHIFRGVIPGSIVIVYKGDGKNRKYLLTKAVQSKNVMFPSGSISWGENFKNAAIRELWEEAGLYINKPCELPIIHKFRYKSILFKPKSEQHVFVYKLNKSEENIKLHSKETEWFKWTNQNETQKLITHKELVDTFKNALMYFKD